MRDIIYRGKTKDGEWEYGGVVIYEKDAFIITKEDFSWSIMGDRGDYDGCITPVLPETVGQFVGLTDKNGKKVFEGDIVEAYNLLGESEGIGVVQWSDTFAGWHISKTKGMYCADIMSYEIIGNVFENNELLEVK